MWVKLLKDWRRPSSGRWTLVAYPDGAIGPKGRPGSTGAGSEHANSYPVDCLHVVTSQSDRVLELQARLPEDWQVTVSVRDADGDAVLGEARLDLENRLLSGHRACAGLPAEYCRYGWQKWRESSPPSAILADLCSAAGLPPPTYGEHCVTVGNVTVTAPEDSPTGKSGASAPSRSRRTCGDAVVPPGERTEDAALRALLRWQDLVPGGKRLLRAALETVALEPTQARLQLWVDVLPPHPPPPPPLHVAPPPARPLLLTLDVRSLDGVAEHEPGGLNLVARAWLSGCKAGAVSSPPVAWSAGQPQQPQVQLRLPLLYSPLHRRLLAPHRQLRRLRRPHLHLQLHHLPSRAARKCLGTYAHIGRYTRQPQSLVAGVRSRSTACCPRVRRPDPGVLSRLSQAG
ncbi:fer-1-like protein 4 [Frankliniella occidentalis]|uniref:Fer-1-like protein 4 n=1 Tax=Frankliniella occidentalis TaxID=133901 RepID=A0A9C6U5D4_FRAOC|nr:fer-1-like protein 4 [Frankliniella occidentalis]